MTSQEKIKAVLAGYKMTQRGEAVLRVALASNPVAAAYAAAALTPCI
jgi:hypothetical protein